jgi:hypothetical protein
MYEFTHKGWWFRWGALDRAGKILAGSSLAAATLAGVPPSFAVARYAYGLGFAQGSGRPFEGDPVVLAPWMALWLVGFGFLSAVLWWRFSRRQDEMFNRIQNWALGMAGAWTATLLCVWHILSLSGLVAGPGGMAAIVAFWLGILIFWMVAVKRWA